MEINLKHIKKKLRHIQIIPLKRGNNEYNFHLFPFGERGTSLDYKTIKELSTEMIKFMKNLKINYSIVSPEPGGTQWGLLASFLLKKDLKIIRKNYIPGSKKVKITNNYSSHYFYIKDILPGETVIIVDDVISSGNTMRSVLKELIALKCKVLFIQVIAVKGKDYKNIIREFNIPIKHIFEIK